MNARDLYVSQIRACEKCEQAAEVYADAIQHFAVRGETGLRKDIWGPVNDVLCEKWGRSSMEHVKELAWNIVDAREKAAPGGSHVE